MDVSVEPGLLPAKVSNAGKSDEVFHDRSANRVVSKYGFKVKLDHKFPEKWRQMTTVRPKQIPQLFPLAMRYLLYYKKITGQGRLPLMDYVHAQNGRQIYGVPIGGLGGGSINRGFKGEFCRYALRPGIYEYKSILANQFILTIQDSTGGTIYHQVLSTERNPKHLKSWKWGFDGSKATYTGLFPRAWTTYDIDEHNVKLICRQVSPIIPNNYKDSSLPCAVFIWEIENNSDKELSVSITFTFKNGTGNKSHDKEGEKWTEHFDSEETGVSGVMIHQKLYEMPCTYGISGRSKDGVKVTRTLSFDPAGKGDQIWEDLETDGRLDEKAIKTSPRTNGPIAAAVSSRVFLKANESKDLEFALVWDMPKIHFRNKMREYMRYYTKYFHDSERSVAPEISSYALSTYQSWESEIVDWQREVLDDPDLPEWYKSALFNELYYVVDGGTIWVREEESDDFPSTDPRKEYGRFAYLEGQEYRMYNTYDVHFYASFALAQLWPRLQEGIQHEFHHSVNMENPDVWATLYAGEKQLRKKKGSIPHDLGDPDEEPFALINAYPIHDVSEWRDLNPKYVVSCYRDYKFFENDEFLKNLWPTIKQVMDLTHEWDKDGDGLIENSGFPDQTFDSWVMQGPSAYCGGLWLAALKCASKIAEILGHDQDSKRYSEVLERGKHAYQEKLWNGQYYNFDGSNKGYSKSIMSDQLCGHWFLRASGFAHDVFPEDRVKTTLKTIYDNNVMKYKNGMQGAVNGFKPNGGIDTVTIQSEEMWTGVTYGLAALMIHEGMTEMGFKTAEGVYRTIYEKIGMGFETPEALYENKGYRAIGYMRPLAIWGMQHAWRAHKKRAT
ncbi:non-lysosomal glucosylceramidase [Athalia rosae]|uniref:non-lysosomal glucosylceramidase n=1 Tax=Athalia rosae TaxID=37344 RepID=UPI002033FE85|nr:non-lysosomal glucosylceramidase [Athalia rosae]